MPVNDHIVHLENGLLHSDTPRAKIDKMVDAAVTHAGDGPIVMHFHGGLINFPKGVAIAERLHNTYQPAGAFPIYFVWESGLLDTITNNLGEIANERVFRIIWKRVRAIVKRKSSQIQGGRNIGFLPPLDDNSFEALIDQAVETGTVKSLENDEPDELDAMSELSQSEIALLEAELGFDPELSSEVYEISASLRDPAEVEEEANSRSTTIVGSTRTLIDPATLNEYVEGASPGSRGIVSLAKIIRAVVMIAGRVITRYVRKRDHGLHATIVEEILHSLYLANAGGLVWSLMKKDTADSFGNDPQIHGGTAVLDALQERVGDNDPPRIILIGHSTGAVYISKLLEHARTALHEKFKFDVVFLAPASTCQLMAKTIDNDANRINDIRMFTMTDANEKADQLVPVLYPHSLLYFVSGVVEKETDMPIVGMQRFFNDGHFPDSRFAMVGKTRDYLSASPKRISWSEHTNGPPGRDTRALSHGDFDNDPTTLDSLTHIIQHGL